MGYVEWFTGVLPWDLTCGWPPRNKGTNVSPSEDAIRAAKGHMGSILMEQDEVELDPEI